MITLDDVRRGFEHGVVTFCTDNLVLNGIDCHLNGEVVCRIGYCGIDGLTNNWFYFAGEDGKDTTVSNLIEEAGLDNVLEWVTNALNESIREIDEGEYAFYEAVLAEC